MIKILVVGIGQMGFAHAKAYSAINGFEIVGFVARDFSKWANVTRRFPDIAYYTDYEEALKATKPDAVCISTYTDTHAQYALKALERNAHVFVEKPLATTYKDAVNLISTARMKNKKLLVGYILHYHPTWQKFIEICREYKHALSVKITSHQYSTGNEWQTHKNILSAGLSPLADCGIHFVDVMGQVMQERPVSIQAEGKKLSDEIDIANAANMLIEYKDGSNLVFESSFGPMIDQDLINIRQCTSQTEKVDINDNKTITVKTLKGLEIIDCEGLKDDSLTIRQQEYFLKTIKDDIDLEDHWNDALLSLEIVLAAEYSMKNKLNVEFK
jgi:predicted dehydrogenase